MQVLDETGSAHFPRSTLTRRINRTLGVLTCQVTGIRLRMRDAALGAGNEDKLCVIRAALTNGREIVVVARDKDYRRAIRRCLHRGRMAIERETAGDRPISPAAHDFQDYAYVEPPSLQGGRRDTPARPACGALDVMREPSPRDNLSAAA